MNNEQVEAVIEARELRESFRGQRAVAEAVRGAPIDVAVGEIFIPLGPNGAGKTTTLRTLTKLITAGRRPHGSPCRRATASSHALPARRRSRLYLRVAQPFGSPLLAASTIADMRVAPAKRVESSALMPFDGRTSVGIQSVPIERRASRTHAVPGGVTGGGSVLSHKGE